MSYHNIPTSAIQSTTNAQGQTAPTGYHYMPDGTLMSDVEHARLYGGKIITSFDLDLSSIKQAGETRGFTVSGDPGAAFSLEIKNEVNEYYNFFSNTFTSTKARLQNQKIGGGVYSSSITFPETTGNDQYDIYLYAESGTKHIDHNEVRFEDNTLDINSSTGSNSSLLQKVIYQYVDLELSISCDSPNFAIEITAVGPDAAKTSTITMPRGGKKTKTPFEISCAVGTTAKCYQVLKQPTVSDVLSYNPFTMVSQLDLPGENIYPTVTGVDTVNGAKTSGTTVTMDTAVADKMKIGDRIHTTAYLAGGGAHAIDSQVVTVASLDSEFDFSLSTAIAVADELSLSFKNRMNHRWSSLNILNLKERDKIITGTNTTSNSSIAPYREELTIMPSTESEEVIVLNSADAIESTGFVVLKGIHTTQTGNITFNNQQPLALAGDAINIGNYGTKGVDTLFGYKVKFSDLKIELATITTTTTSAVTDSTKVPVASRNGILDNVSVVSGIGINPSVENPTVVSGAGDVDGPGTIVLSAAQTLDSGQTLTFVGAGQVATITGNIEVLQSGTSSANIKFDVERLLSIA